MEKSRAELLILVHVCQKTEEGYCCYPCNTGTLPCVCICIFFPFCVTLIELKTVNIITIKSFTLYKYIVLMQVILCFFTPVLFSWIYTGKRKIWIISGNIKMVPVLCWMLSIFWGASDVPQSRSVCTIQQNIRILAARIPFSFHSWEWYIIM